MEGWRLNQNLPFLCEFLIINLLLIFYYINYLLLIKKLINRHVLARIAIIIPNWNALFYS